MKRILFSILTMGSLTVGAYANPIIKRAPKQEWKQQLAAYVICPEGLQKTAQKSVLVVSFRINEENRLEALQIFSGDQQLNEALIRQLTGKKVNAPKDEQGITQLVRLRFLPN